MVTSAALSRSKCGATELTLETADEVVTRDLEYMRAQLPAEFSRMAGKSLLITGGAGFLGYYLIQAIVFWNRTVEEARRIQITVCENYMRGAPRWFLTLEAAQEMRVMRHDVSEPLPAGIGAFQFIIHAAGIASPTYYRAHPVETMDANVTGLRHLLDYWRRQKDEGREVGGFLFLSSSEIYGDPEPGRIPTPESYRGNVSCTGPRACYDESKRFGETLCVTYARHFQLPVRIVRPFNNYGPGLKITDRRVVSDFARDVFANRDIALYSDGLPTRTFCYIADAIVGYYKILVHGRDGEAYNIGTDGPEISMLDLARRMAGIASELFGYNGQVVHRQVPTMDYLTDNPSRRCPMIAKARTEVGYNPGVSLEDGLRRSLIWYSAHLEAEEK